jgi:BolA protein
MKQPQIEKKLHQELNPIHLEVINESHMHHVPPGSESHFKLVVVSELFEGKRLIARHRIINQLLSDELSDFIHALSMHTYSPQEWETVRGEVPASPKCAGSNKQKT